MDNGLIVPCHRRLVITDAGERTLFPGQVVSVKVEKTFDYDVAGRVVGSP